MSMLGISFLEEIINYRGITYPGKILDELRKEVLHALHQKGKGRSQGRDGYISLCDHRQAGNISFSGAYNNLYLISDNGHMKFLQTICL